jgi:hypothetical protein
MGVLEMKNRGLQSGLLGIAALCLAALPAWGNVPTAPPSFQNEPAPGALNYVEGSADLQGQPLNNRDVGASTMDPGQVLHTANGKAEVLLTPGVFLRVGDNSSVKMISPDISNTQVELLNGEAGVEVDEIYPQNDLQIIDNGVTTRLEKRGFYEFLANPSANQSKVLVFSGKAQVEVGDGRYKGVGKGHEMVLVASAQEKPHGFNINNAQDNLYNWSKLRSQYMAEQNEQVAENYGWDWAPYPGWYWNPWGWGWWGPGLGLWGYPGPFFYGGGYWGRGYYGGHYGHPIPGGYRGGEGFHGGFGGGGFHGGGGFGGGGMHGGR